MSEFEELSEDGLLEDLRKTEAELEDLEEGRRFTLGQNSPSSGPYRADQPSFLSRQSQPDALSADHQIK